MSAQRQQQIQTPREFVTLPDDLRSPQAKLVFHSLDAAGCGCADELADRLSMQKMTLLSVLKSLEGQGLVEKQDGEYFLAAS